MSEDYENKISLVGFAGMKQSGKTTSAKALKHHGYRIYSFADPIRKLCRALAKNITMETRTSLFPT